MLGSIFDPVFNDFGVPYLGPVFIRVRGGAPERLLGTLLSEFFFLLLFVLRGSRARPALPLKLKRKGLGAAGRATRDPRPA